ncbi:glycosyltransferase family 4 protein [Ornithinimicrobium pekingense]|uniref:Glycosyl transferase n=1 Tax=Ornithinimicrobium pekingense TaxID=384677 RepID=A0ABQ2FBR0_9MICO|nr:glycosyltransferase family 4 protein [Ornithinimicrobium pekingense]GGK78880.1 glycosyl transferase [Ornithinimicrobium pekingense]
MTRVAYVCADPGIPVFGTKGASVHIQELVRAWRARGADVEVYAVRRGDDVPADLAGLPVHVVPVAKGEDPAAREVAQRRAAAELAAMVLEAAPDVVHERYSLFSTVLPTVRAAHSCTTVLEVNAPLIDEQRTHRVLVDEAAAELALADQLAAADVVACVSEPVAAWVRQRAEALPDRRAVLSCHNGRPDDARVTTEPHERAEAAVSGGAAITSSPATGGPAVVVTPNGVNTDRVRAVTPDLSGDPVVVFVGTLKPWHGVEDLVRAAALARVPWRLRLVGDGPQRAALEQLAAEHGVELEMVGAVAPEQVPAALEGASVAVAPYPDSGGHYFSPLKVYEYGAAALPVVASRIGEIPTVVADGHTGLLVPPSDPRALAAAIDTLAADPATARRMGAAARVRMESRHSWAHVLDATLAPVAHHLTRVPAGDVAGRPDADRLTAEPAPVP